MFAFPERRMRFLGGEFVIDFCLLRILESYMEVTYGDTMWLGVLMGGGCTDWAFGRLRQVKQHRMFIMYLKELSGIGNDG